jgi:hypothetical protein
MEKNRKYDCHAERSEASRVLTFANVIDYCAMRDASLRSA